MVRRNTKFLGLIFATLIHAVPALSFAGLPKDQVQATADKVLAILQDPALKAQEQKLERRNQLRQAISARFDFNEMAKRSLASHWQNRSADEQRRFVELFTALLERSYAEQIESFNGEKIIYGREKQESGHAEVDTKIATQKGQEYSVNYKLHQVSQEWRVYDVVIENISLINNYRAQFNRLLSKSSFAELLQELRGKGLDAPAGNSKQKSGASKE